MVTRHLTSADGLVWSDQGAVLQGRPGRWDARGARVTALLGRSPLRLAYDGRPDAASNWFETTGIAVEREGVLVPDDALRLSSPVGDGACRYASVVDTWQGRRWYLEVSRADGAHDLVTVLA